MASDDDVTKEETQEQCRVKSLDDDDVILLDVTGAM